MPLFNKENEVLRAVHSVMAQTFSNWEMIVVDDGSTDCGVERLASIDDSRIACVHQKNAGVSAARNRGVEAARSQLLAFLDADDEWLPGCLEKMWHLKETYPECSVFAVKSLTINADGERLKAILKGLPDGWEGIIPDYFAIAAQSDPPLNSSNVMIRKEALISIGGFPVGILSGEDLLTWAHLAFRYPIALSSAPYLSIFYSPASPKNGQPRSNRHAVGEDRVAQELRTLLQTAPKQRVAGMKQYLALWHRMRASNFLDNGWNQAALSELFKSFRFGGLTLRVAFLTGLALLPKAPAKALRRASRWLVNSRRKKGLNRADQGRKTPQSPV
ncbi:MAG: glycosyltransferase family 2 protein [Magnetococcales bacterium]|nr:glycosyltransferase family 2 protein [Magnetococcales bacterium]